MAFLKCVFFVCVLVSSLARQTLGQPCDGSDLLALNEFAGNLSDGSIITAWSKINCCQRDGVFCESYDNGSVGRRRVTMLTLPKKGLKGNISSSLGSLDRLKLLNLSFNHLQGGLPEELSRLKQLEVLDLSHNMLSGPVSRVISVLLSIQSLDISSNLFNEELLELGEFPYLSVFNISNNSFTGQVSTKLCNFFNRIHILDLSMNHLLGNLGGLSNCSTSLLELHLDNNGLFGALPDSLYSLLALERLSITNNNFSGQLSKELSKLSSLKTLAISGNQFSGQIPDVFDNLTQLEQLLANSNIFSGLLPSTLASCSKLHILDLRNNSLSGQINLNFTAMPSLSTLDIASNHFSGYLPNSLSDCHKLKILSLAKNRLEGQIPESFVSLTALSFVSLSNNSFRNLPRALFVLQYSKNLSTLILPKNFIGEEIPTNISGFENLAVLGLGNCALKGQIPDWLSGCRKLQLLDLSMNQLGGSIPPWIGQMDHLFYLDLSNNSLSGEMPKGLASLKSLIYANYSYLTDSAGIPIYVKRNQSGKGLPYKQVSNFPPSIILCNNRINGTIFPEIGLLKQLHVLDLSKNNITGTIPDSISEMTNLEALDLSSNNLYGSIPLSFEKLTFLSQFNVAYNQLRGRIPTGGQFYSFPNSSFEGNPELCGGVFSRCANDSILKPVTPSNSKIRLGVSKILVITLTLGVGLAIVLAVLWLKVHRRDMGNPIDSMDEETSRQGRLSDSFQPSKMVHFQNSDYKDLTVADLLKSTNNFNQANIIGCGGFGLVYKASLPDGTKAAIKRLSEDCGQMDREFQAEVQALSRAQHKNLVSLQGYCWLGSDRLLIYSYMENGSLDYWLHESVDGVSTLKWELRLKIAQGAASGLAYLHKVCEPHIVHRDVKSSNILLDENFEAHLADFGLSRLLRPYDTHVTTDLVGTLGYIPPEYSQTLTATCRGDVYSFGVVLLEILTSRRPVEVCKGKSCRDLVSWVFQMKSEKREAEVIDPSIWDEDRGMELLDVLEIACRCLDHDPRRRPLIEEVVSLLDSIGVQGTYD
ncbi:hypothetical protein K2173_014414 [Erythroxylum novogranatense]|uniref:non-specific serine/threonine protein kinase n=1 Tax=Erythroxylum novogranatense TaxID=1862640 RepID=A0AAV8S5K6_9ROSI|nr:hypothetical protein K2173_014414 [Erythroxylum novogranatense]